MSALCPRSRTLYRLFLDPLLLPRRIPRLRPPPRSLSPYLPLRRRGRDRAQGEVEGRGKGRKQRQKQHSASTCSSARVEPEAEACVEVEVEVTSRGRPKTYKTYTDSCTEGKTFRAAGSYLREMVLPASALVGSNATPQELSPSPSSPHAVCQHFHPPVRMPRETLQVCQEVPTLHRDAQGGISEPRALLMVRNMHTRT